LFPTDLIRQTDMNSYKIQLLNKKIISD